ncbi:MAG TPA: hypothetical protein PLN54_02685 [Flavobacteriales bacterium]|nr:hypothetical protein [Flavobacteriales bacterium]
MTVNLRSLLLGAAVPMALLLGYSFRPTPAAEAFTYRQFSTIESVVPGGMGRSRVIISDQGDQEVGKDLLNFYSMVGINFKNIANNDRIIVETINQYVSEGWELHTVTTGVQSPNGDKGGNGIFITRYLFRKPL